MIISGEKEKILVISQLEYERAKYDVFNRLNKKSLDSVWIENQIYEKIKKDSDYYSHIESYLKDKAIIKRL